MTVYVDNARNKYGRMIMCHLLADSPEELHTMASAIGLQRNWYQSPDKASFPHYDLSQSKRDLAVAKGAKQISRSECGEFMKRIKLAIISQGKTWKSSGWMLVIVVLLSLMSADARAEGLVPTPWGWRAAPCCREAGYPSPYQGRPPHVLVEGVLAPAFWGEIVPRLLEYLPPTGLLQRPITTGGPVLPPDSRKTLSAPPLGAKEPARESREQTKKRLFEEMRNYCKQWPEDTACPRKGG